MIVDGYSRSGILKYEPLEVVLDTTAKAGVDRAVLCQHLGEVDNSYLAQVAGSRPEQFAAVLLVNPAEPESVKNRAAASKRSPMDKGDHRGFGVVARNA